MVKRFEAMQQGMYDNDESGEYVLYSDYIKLETALKRIRYAFGPADFAYQVADEAIGDVFSGDSTSSV